MKIKFPFFSKKFPWVCTTDQVVHQVDGKDKKLSDILGDTNRYGFLRINGKEVYEIGEVVYDLYSNIERWASSSPISYIYFNKGFDLQITKTSNNSATFELYNNVISLTCDVSFEEDLETGDLLPVVENFRMLPYNEALQEQLGGELSDLYSSLDGKNFLDIINIDND